MTVRKDVLQVRVSAEEKAEVGRLAAGAGLKVSEWVRRQALAGSSVPAPVVKREPVEYGYVRRSDGLRQPEDGSDGDYTREPVFE